MDIAGPVAQGVAPATPDDLAETARLVEAAGRRMIARQANVTDLPAVTAAVDEGVAELGRLDIVVANAGVGGTYTPLASTPSSDWDNVIAINLTGVLNIVKATVPHLIAGGRGGSIVLGSSAMTLRAKPGMGAYLSAKTGLIGLMQTLALELGDHFIRVNAVLPTTVPTPMLLRERTFRALRPDLENPSLEDVKPVFPAFNVLPVPYVEVEDVANAVLFLASDEARYITGIQLPVDAGYALK